MKECDKFAVGSRQWQICTHTADLPGGVMDAYRVRWGLTPLLQTKPPQPETEPPVPELVFHGRSLSEGSGRLIVHRAYGPGTELLAIFHEKGVPLCPECEKLAQDMNDWGVAECRKRLDAIVADILPRAIAWWEDNRPWATTLVPGLGAGVVVEFFARRAIKGHVEAAIAACEGKMASRLTKRLETYTGERIRGGGCCGGSGKPVGVIRVAGHSGNPMFRVMPMTPEQDRLHAELLRMPPPTPEPFVGQPVLHLGAHIWPIKGNWERHTSLWAELSEIINGRCIVGVVTGPGTVTFDEVRRALPGRFELFETPNTSEGETPTFRELQNRVPSGPDDILIYCHGKGVRAHTAASPAVRVWTELMYETVVFNTEAIVARMEQGYRTFGAFRTFGRAPLSPRYQWHYSGTFFAIRAKYLPDKVVKKGYGGVEAWPGDHFPANLGWNERWDSRPLKGQYDIESLYPDIINDGMQWEADRLGGPRCEQHKRELLWWMEQLSIEDRVLVIGSKHGGLEWQLLQRFPGMQITSIDIAPQPDNTSPQLIVGSSAESSIQEKVRALGSFDAVFIDGDHTYVGAKADYEFALTLQPRMIAFHDVAKAIKHEREGCEVDRLWDELKVVHHTQEKIVGCGWGGIGVVTFSESR